MFLVWADGWMMELFKDERGNKRKRRLGGWGQGGVKGGEYGFMCVELEVSGGF